MNTSPLMSAFNAAVLHIASRLFPLGYDVSPDGPSTYNELVYSKWKTGRMVVWSGASDHTIFADREVNWAFRAWHDHCHMRGPYPFTKEGEREVLAEQIRDIRKLYGYGEIPDAMCDLLRAEVIGQSQYCDAHNGLFPADQMAFARAYVVDPQKAVHRDF